MIWCDRCLRRWDRRWFWSGEGKALWQGIRSLYRRRKGRICNRLYLSHIKSRRDSWEWLLIGNIPCKTSYCEKTGGNRRERKCIGNRSRCNRKRKWSGAFWTGDSSAEPAYKDHCTLENMGFKIKGRLHRLWKRHNIPIPVSKEKIYSWSQIYGISAMKAETWKILGMSMKMISIWWAYLPRKHRISPPMWRSNLKKAYRVAIDGKGYDPVQLIQTLNQIAGANGVGTIDTVENRRVEWNPEAHMKLEHRTAVHGTSSPWETDADRGYDEL